MVINDNVNVMYCKSPETSQRPQKPCQGDQLNHWHYTKSKAMAKFLVSFCGQVNIREGQAEETDNG